MSHLFLLIILTITLLTSGCTLTAWDKLQSGTSTISHVEDTFLFSVDANPALCHKKILTPGCLTQKDIYEIFPV